MRQGTEVTHVFLFIHSSVRIASIIRHYPIAMDAVLDFFYKKLKADITGIFQTRAISLVIFFIYELVRSMQGRDAR